jgi:spore coat protein I
VLHCGTDEAGGDCMQGIEKEIAENYGFDVKNCIQYKDSFLAITSAGRKLIKRIQFSPERLLFVHGAKEHLAAGGFTGIDRYMTTLSGDPFFCFSGSLFVVTDFIDGRESSFESDADIRKASSALAGLHRASAGYIPPEGCKVQNELGKLPGYFSKRLDDIRKMRKQAKKGQSRFDQLFLRHADYFIDMGENALDRLSASNYKCLVERAAEERSFCHHDFTHHNVIIDSGKVIIINFDFCCYELRVYDIANLIRRKMRKSGWDISKAGSILNEYGSISPLSRDELEIMRIILGFPQKFWRVVNRYYNSRRSWSEKIFIGRLQEVIDETGPFEAFIRAYDRVFL